MKFNAKQLTYSHDDLIITDPPYNIGYKYNGTYRDNLKLEEYQQLFMPMKGQRVVLIHYIENIISDIVPILGAPQRVISWTYPSNTASRCWRAIAWFNCKPDFSKIRVPYKNMQDKRVRELYKKTGGRALPDNWNINLVKNVSKEKIKEYTNQIPEEVIKRIIITTAKTKDTIVDPFSGTGTTAAVAKDLGYRYRWYDINDLAVELTIKRLNNISEKLFYYND